MKRRLPPAQFDLGAVAKWERLLTAARTAAADPMGDASRLGSAAMKAMKATSIPGQHTRDSEALQLVLLGQRFASLQPEQRRAEAPRLERLALAVAGYLAVAKDRLTAPPARRIRADIDQ